MRWVHNFSVVNHQLLQVGSGGLYHLMDNRYPEVMIDGELYRRRGVTLSGAPRQTYQRTRDAVYVYLTPPGSVQLCYQHRDVRLRIEQV